MKRIAVIIILILSLGVISYKYSNLIADNKRISNNFKQIQHTNQFLELTVDEFKYQLSEVNYELDSILKASKIKPNKVTEVQQITTIYKDTATYTYQIQDLDTIVKSGGISFRIESIGLDTIQVSNIESKNTTTLICYYKVRWIFWKRYEYKLLTDYGEVSINKIVIKRK